MMKDYDFKLLRGFADGQTNEQTFVIVESLSQLKRGISNVTLLLYINKPSERKYPIIVCNLHNMAQT